jgi:hypothetical protein
MSNTQNTGHFKKGKDNPNWGIFGRKKPEGAGSPSIKIEVVDKYSNLTISFDSISAASRALNISFQVISNYLIRNQTKPYKNRYIFKKKDDSSKNK